MQKDESPLTKVEHEESVLIQFHVYFTRSIRRADSGLKLSCSGIQRIARKRMYMFSYNLDVVSRIEMSTAKRY